MMSAAILTTTGAERNGARPVVHEAEGDERATFAQSFDARVASSPKILGADTAADVLPGRSSETELTAKNPVETPRLTLIEKEETSGLQATAGGIESHRVIATKPDPQQSASAAGVHFRQHIDVKGTPIEELSEYAELDSETVTADPSVVSNSGLQADNATPQVIQGDGSHVLTALAQTPVGSKESAAPNNAQTAAVLKKSTKTQLEEVTLTTPSRSGTTSAHLGAEANGSIPGVVHAYTPVAGDVAMAYGATIALPIAASGVADNDMAEGETSGATLVGGTGSVSAASASSVTSTRKSSIPGAKDISSSVETIPATPGDQSPSAKLDAKTERSQTVGANEGDIGARGRGESAVVASRGSISGTDVVAGVAVPSVIGNMRVQNGEAGAHGSNPSTGMKEQASSPDVSRSMELMPRTLSVSPTVLEVGVLDGTHGWLKVRAEMTDGGGVNASVSSSSATGEEMLHRELPSLTAYLQSEKVVVNAVVVPSTGVGPAEPQSHASGAESGGSGLDASQRGNEGREQRQDTATGVTKEVTGYQGLHGVGEDGIGALPLYAWGGGWLSVRA